MVKLIFDDWSWRCESCKSPMALPGIAPSLEMLKKMDGSIALYAERKLISRQQKQINRIGLSDIKATMML